MYDKLSVSSMEIREKVDQLLQLRKIPKELHPYFDPHTRIEIVDLPLDSDDTLGPKLEKIRQLAALGADIRFVHSSQAIDQSDRRRVILGGAVGNEDWCVPQRQQWLEERGIKATIDPTITLYHEDLKSSK